jgi:hypothetical protein
VTKISEPATGWSISKEVKIVNSSDNINDESNNNNNNNTQFSSLLDIYPLNSYKAKCRNSIMQPRLTALRRNNNKDNSLKATL